ncbi:MAG TPA: hypothetical protein VMK12_12860 [Anaeromyxobacteraceae bacterium]|nr:hypothetical protein [Anaeromyxobacteraceae bacterium]
MTEPDVEPLRDEAQPEVEISDVQGARGSVASAPPRRHRLLVAGIVVAVVVGVAVYQLIHAGKEHSDDAQVDADIVPLARRVAGQVTVVPVAKSEAVKAGELILLGRDYQARLARALAEPDGARAGDLQLGWPRQQRAAPGSRSQFAAAQVAEEAYRISSAQLAAGAAIAMDVARCAGWADRCQAQPRSCRFRARGGARLTVAMTVR